MDLPQELKYTKEHEWVRVEGDDTVTIGITDYAQDSLGDVVFVELPAADDEIATGDTFGVVESVKAVSDLYGPVNGTVTEVNDPLIDSPELLNDDPYGEAWMIKVKLNDASDMDGLLSAEDYEKYVEEEN